MNKTFSTLLRALAITALCSSMAHAQTYQQVWSDEFNGTAVNTANWAFETGTTPDGWGNHEREYYQASNATVANGELLITAKKQSVGGMPYTSARLKTQGLQNFQFGRIEARIKMPLGQGLWPAFWMLGSNISTVNWPYCGEIDVMEHINATNTIYGTAHWDNNAHASYSGNTTTTPADYHVYSVEWDTDYLRWFVDGVKYHEMVITNGTGGTEEFQKPFFLLLNLAVGGDWPGQTVDETKLPATMYVDYVRVSKKVTSTLIQAEAYSSMSGVQIEACSDAGGGQDVGYIDAGDWMAYNAVNFPTSGAYTIEYRVASPGGSRLSSDLNAGSIQLGTVTIPATGGWQNWTTVSQTVNVNAGTYNFGVYVQAGGWNLNWLRITKVAARSSAVTAAGSAKAGTLGVSVYPNPVEGQLRLHAAETFRGGQLSILDMTGREVYAGRYQGEALEVGGLTPGLYQIVLRQGDQTSHLRFVKQ